jgi:hypothetical protein
VGVSHQPNHPPAVQQYSNQSMRVWYNPITDKPARTLPTLAVAESVEERRAGRGGPCARIGSRRGPLAWACGLVISIGKCR